MKKFYVFFFILFLSGCQTNNFKDYYVDENINLSPSPLSNSDDPVKVIETSILEKTLTKYKEKGYAVIGTSFFEGLWCPRAFAIELAKEKKAQIVIIESIPTKEEKINYTVAVPQTNTTYHHGNISTKGNYDGYISGYGSYSGNTSSNATYTGYSTSTSWNYHERSYSVVYFFQKAFFLRLQAKNPTNGDKK